MKTRILLAVGLLLAAPGCAGRDGDDSAEGPQPATFSFDQVQLETPSRWVAELRPELDGAIIYDPTYDGELRPQAYLLRIDKWDYTPGRMDEALDDHLAVLRAGKNGLVLKRKEAIAHEQGFVYGLIEYVFLHPEAQDLVTERCVVIPRVAGGATAGYFTTEAEAWMLYEPIFDAMIDSIRIER